MKASCIKWCLACWLINYLIDMPRKQVKTKGDPLRSTLQAEMLTQYDNQELSSSKVHLSDRITVTEQNISKQ